MPGFAVVNVQMHQPRLTVGHANVGGSVVPHQEGVLFEIHGKEFDKHASGPQQIQQFHRQRRLDVPLRDAGTSLRRQP